MPKQVAAPDVAQPRRLHAVTHHLGHPVIRERLTRYRQEQRAVVTAIASQECQPMRVRIDHVYRLEQPLCVAVQRRWAPAAV